MMVLVGRLGAVPAFLVVVLMVLMVVVVVLGMVVLRPAMRRRIMVGRMVRLRLAMVGVRGVTMLATVSKMVTIGLTSSLKMLGAGRPRLFRLKLSFGQVLHQLRGWPGRCRFRGLRDV